jgi:hypothetical protein
LASPSLLRPDKEPETSYLPQPVRRTINEYKGEGDLKKVKTKRAKGRTYYEVEYKEGGDQKEILIAEDGSVLREFGGGERGKAKGKNKDKDKWKNGDTVAGRDSDDADERKGVGKNERRSDRVARGENGKSGTHPVKWENLPSPVKSAITSRSDMGTVQKVERETHGNTTLYHAHYQKGTVSYNWQGKIVDRDKVFAGK